jgi:hypothetical protein
LAESFRDIPYSFQANSKLILKLEHYCFYSVLPNLLFANNRNVSGYCVPYSIVKVIYNNELRYIKKWIRSTIFVTSYVPVEILTVYTTHFYITMIIYFYFIFYHFTDTYNFELCSSPYYEEFLRIYIYT